MSAAGQSDERALLARAVGWPSHPSLEDLVPAVLADVAREHGIDFATAVLYDRLRRSPRHRPFIERVELASAARDLSGWPGRLVVVPGAFHAEFPRTGAYGDRMAAAVGRLGYPARPAVVPTESFGRVSDNARILLDWLASDRAAAASGDVRPVVLVSLSKGGAEVSAALADPAADAFAGVAAWVDFGGLIHGTPMADWVCRGRLRPAVIRLWLRWHGLRFDAVRDLLHRPPTTHEIAPRIRTVHVRAFPLRRHLHSAAARRAHARLAAFGPNDGGGVLLSDAAALPGVVYPVWGTDHYHARGRDLDDLLARLLWAALGDGP